MADKVEALRADRAAEGSHLGHALNEVHNAQRGSRAALLDAPTQRTPEPGHLDLDQTNLYGQENVGVHSRQVQRKAKDIAVAADPNEGNHTKDVVVAAVEEAPHPLHHQEAKVTKDKEGRVTEVTTEYGAVVKYGYGADGKLTDVKMPGATWHSTDGQHWTVTRDGHKLPVQTEEINVDSHGTLTIKHEGGVVDTYTTDGTLFVAFPSGETVVKKADGHMIMSNADGDIERVGFPNGDQIDVERVDGQPPILILNRLVGDGTPMKIATRVKVTTDEYNNAIYTDDHGNPVLTAPEKQMADEILAAARGRQGKPSTSPLNWSTP